ncbi:hypothetical protein QVD17_15019 [Tagetes erecta]|uniref:Uncharacterized protein n=1 Tax=Tagetes erecta TaxID=13708 RepID=A0AAD8NYB5_TARER|nr:hypothetical protein QVD17_15019 [Tagetes erecta]
MQLIGWLRTEVVRVQTIISAPRSRECSNPGLNALILDVGWPPLKMQNSYHQSKPTLSKPQFQQSRHHKKNNQVFLQGYVETSNEEEITRAKSLTDDDLKELKGCLDLGFGFSYDEIPELCNTLPALELCYSMSRKFLDEQQKSSESPETLSGGKASWKISSPGDDPEDVKARLKFWAQAVACTVKLCR